MPTTAQTVSPRCPVSTPRSAIRRPVTGLLRSGFALATTATAFGGTLPAFAQAVGDPGLWWLGYPAGGYDVSYAYDVSADGGVVVGTAGSSNLTQVAFRWDADTGMTALPGSGVDGRGISGDASTVIGYHIVPDGGGGSHVEAFRWTQAGGMLDLGTGGYTSSVANGVSSDGSVIVGEVSGAGQNVAFAWTEATGMQLLGWMAGGAPSTRATDVSDTGILVGNSRMAGGDYQAFYKDLGSVDGLQGLGYFGGGDYSRAEAITNDANFIVGEATDSGNVGHAVRWTWEGAAYGSAMALDGGTGWIYSEATDIAADGATVVGQYILVDEADGTVAFRWTEASGAQSLDAWLAESGVVVGGWILREATAISDDGSTIVGWGEAGAGQYQAFLARAGVLFGTTDYAHSVASLQEVARLPSAIATGRLLHSLPAASGMPGLSASFDFEHVQGSSSNLGGGMLTWRQPGWAITGGGGAMLMASSPLYGGGSATYSGAWLGGGAAVDLGTAFAVPALDGLELSVGARADMLQATINRNYLNGSAIETAIGQTGISTLTGAIRASWNRPLGDTLAVTPYAQWLVGRSTMAGYRETGGAGAGTVSEQVNTTNLVTAGIEADLKVSSKVTIGVSYALNHLLDGSVGGVSVAMPGFASFAAPAASHESTWHSIGVDLEWAPTDRLRLNTYASANLGGTYAENWTIGTGLQVGF
ncbi:hypothetical protein [Devosia salina]|uniref:Autotransporter domain-containing protein n=1 Tax=Devosia salina TaxID=2860336 RepID=A0ABX8WIA4_9HYPH|nr:hypothetical protein [Devosia salina]QYO76025.1 hypothetical protein K1X15_15550 [Devosia salina]